VKTESKFLSEAKPKKEVKGQPKSDQVVNFSVLWLTVYLITYFLIKAF
jgi:hypothetical protein